MMPSPFFWGGLPAEAKFPGGGRHKRGKIVRRVGAAARVPSDERKLHREERGRGRTRAAFWGEERVSGSIGIPPFPADFRASGILLHVTSLPSTHGIGDIGPAAVSWINRLSQADQGWWQALPLGPTGYGNSPYQPLSSFAGNPLVISPDWLVEDDLLEPSDCAHDPFPAASVDYDAIIPFKHRLLEKAWLRFRAGVRPDLVPAYERFCQEQDHWLSDYALFQSLKDKFGNAPYLEWPAELAQRKPAALEMARGKLAEQIGRVCFAQFLLFRHIDRLRAHARAKDLKLIGDLPFFVSPESSDAWAHPELFLLDERRRPRFVAGVPPDYFSAQGQLWGNPVYNWDSLRQSGFDWWIDRLRARLMHVDVIRLDHFRAFSAAWHVPAGAPTAQSGSWVPGPGAEFFRVVERELGSLPFVAEDLGLITPDVYALRDQFHLPGMRVLQFAFDGHSDNPHLPENYVTNTVVYTGTHDNPTTRGWFEDLTRDQKERFWKYLRRQAQSSDAAPGLIELAWTSAAALAMAPLQDILNLGREARMNVPGRADGNWRWRSTENMLSDEAFERMRDLTTRAKRSKVLLAPVPETLASGDQTR
jgi:4-alpha-glucanotransferase